MKNRIKELAEQAGLVTLQHSDEWLDVEKFAELLVKECAHIADLADENKCEWIGGNILTHFGVK